MSNLKNGDIHILQKLHACFLSHGRQFSTSVESPVCPESAGIPHKVTIRPRFLGFFNNCRHYGRRKQFERNFFPLFSKVYSDVERSALA